MISEILTCFLSFLGFALIMFEVPVCCQFVQYTQPVAQFSQQRPPWQKAALYTLFVLTTKYSMCFYHSILFSPPLVPLIFCQSLSIILGFLCILVNGAIQFMLAVGKKYDIKRSFTCFLMDDSFIF